MKKSLYFLLILMQYIFFYMVMVFIFSGHPSIATLTKAEIFDVSFFYFIFMLPLFLLHHILIAKFNLLFGFIFLFLSFFVIAMNAHENIVLQIVLSSLYYFIFLLCLMAFKIFLKRFFNYDFSISNCAQILLNIIIIFIVIAFLLWG